MPVIYVDVDNAGISQILTLLKFDLISRLFLHYTTKLAYILTIHSLSELYGLIILLQHDISKILLFKIVAVRRHQHIISLSVSDNDLHYP